MSRTLIFERAAVLHILTSYNLTQISVQKKIRCRPVEHRLHSANLERVKMCLVMESSGARSSERIRIHLFAVTK